MPYNVCVRYERKSLSWRVVAIQEVDSFASEIHIKLDRERWWVVIPSYLWPRNGTWTNPKKVLEKFWELREEIESNCTSNLNHARMPHQREKLFEVQQQC